MKTTILFILSLLLFYSCGNTYRTFYVDSSSGDDNHPGTSIDKAWKSIERLNKEEFKPGDKILFRSGTEYTGQFEPKGNGSQEAPIIVDKFGEGGKPIIHGQGEKLHTLLLQNISYWEVNNLEITNKGKEPMPRRNGVFVHAQNAGEIHHIHLKNLTVHDVNGSCIKNDGAGNGIFWKNEGDSLPTRFIDLLIEDCHIYNCQRNGITGEGNYERKSWYPSLEVVIRGNLIENVPGDGIVPIACDGALVEYNTMKDSPDLLRIEDAAAGMWPWSCDNTLIQFNEVSGHNAKWDGQGFDSDYNCRNTVIQYNFSHDNAGGMLLICNEGNSLGESWNIGTDKTIIRGNISINDGIRSYPTRPGWFSPVIHISGPAKDTEIEENVILVLKKDSKEIDRSILTIDTWGGPWPERTLFKDNIFYVLNDELPYKFTLGNSIETVFAGNHFFGNFENKPEDAKEKKGALDIVNDFPFPAKYPEVLREKVIQRLREIKME